MTCGLVPGDMAVPTSVLQASRGVKPGEFFAMGLTWLQPGALITSTCFLKADGSIETLHPVGALFHHTIFSAKRTEK